MRGGEGALAAFRDAALFKTIYAFGLRRQEAARLEVTTLGECASSVFRALRPLSVRYGKAYDDSGGALRSAATC